MPENEDKDRKIDESALEEEFNKALDDLIKSIGEDETIEEDLEKSKKSKKKEEDDVPDDVEIEERDEEEPEDEEEEENVKKSLEDFVSEDEDAEAAMDVEPFLRSLVKSIDNALQARAKEQDKKIEKLEKLIKSQAKVISTQAKLQKSLVEKTEKIANTPIPSTSIKRLQKSRFNDKDVSNVTGTEILSKSMEWLRSNKISLLEAGKIENRVNHGSLGTFGDSLDNKVKELLSKEGK